MLDPLLGRASGSVPGRGDLGVVLARDEAAARAGGEVDDQRRCRSRGSARPPRGRARAPSHGAPVSGSRTWMWAIAAPALAASIAAVAICSGVIGRPGCWSGLVMLPVTAQVMMILSAIGSPLRLASARRRDYARPPLPPDRRARPRSRALQQEKRPIISAAATASAAAKPSQTPSPPRPAPKPRPSAQPAADRPVGERGERHRPAGVLQAAQRARADHLAAVEDLEQRRDRQERDRRVHDGRVGRIPGVDEQSDDRAQARSTSRSPSPA